MDFFMHLHRMGPEVFRSPRNQCSSVNPILPVKVLLSLFITIYLNKFIQYINIEDARERSHSEAISKY